MSIPVAPPVLPRTQPEWRAALASLPATPDNIPAFYFAHGSPMLAMGDVPGRASGLGNNMGPKGHLAKFLRDFGPALLEKYHPEAIVVFSAHWDTPKERLVTDYGDENPLLYDYYGFSPDLYKLRFKSRGDQELSNRVVKMFQEAGMPARTTSATETRGRDGRGYDGPGFDHGVFVPFRLMFGEEFVNIPIVEVSFDSSLDPAKNWAVGEAIQRLRTQRVLVLSGGLTIHNLRAFASFSEDTAEPIYKAFDKAVLEAVTVADSEKRKQALFDLTKHAGFRAAHPHEDHFIPLYVAAGAGDGGNAQVLDAYYGVHSYAFGL